jgi:signal transduction histidine kinase
LSAAAGFRGRLFTVAALVGIGISLITAVVNALNAMGPVQIGLSLAAAAAGAGLLWLALATGRYRVAYVVTVVGVFLVIFPLLFFSGGGYAAGMPVFFVFAIAFTAFLLDGALLWVLAGVEAAVYTACCLLAFYRPSLVKEVGAAAAMWDSIYALVAAGASLAVAFHLLLRIYERARDQLARRNRQLAESYQAKSRFLALAAHELNTPLALIQLQAEEALAKGRDTAQTAPQIRHNMEVIAAETARLGRLIDELLDLARIEEGGMTFDIRPEPLGAMIQNTLTAYAPLAAAARVTIVIGRDGPNPIVLADRGRIAQVLVNLLANAVRHAPRGTILVDVAIRGDKAEVSVTDTGEGMPPETLAGLFRAAPAPTLKAARGDGLGLGLVISQHIIEQHGGDMRAESVLGEGTKVSFTLPLVERWAGVP